MREITDGPRGVVVIGASAGGVEAVSRLVSHLSPDIPAAILVAIHIPPFAQSTLPAILNRAGALPAAQGSDAEPLRAGRIYIAGPDRHLLVGSGGRLRVTRGPRENGHRPAVDALFRSAAISYGPATVGVVLTGLLDDGTAGLLAVKSAGGVAIVQSDAMYQDMPRNAMEAVEVDHAAPLDELPQLIADAVAGLPEAHQSGAITITPSAPFQATEDSGPPSDITCPACGGVLTVVGEEPLRFRCRVGHAYNTESLLVNQTQALEVSLWTALRALEERSHTLHRLAARFTKRGNTRQSERFGEERDVTDQRAAIVRRALLDIGLFENEGQLPIASAQPDEEPQDVAG